MNYNRAVMKLEVKQAMRQTRPHPMLVTLLYLVIVGVGAWLISWLMNTLFSWLPGGSASMQNLLMGIMMNGEDYLDHLLNDAPQLFAQMVIQAWISTLLVSVLTAVWNGLMSVGYSGYCLDMSRGMNPQLERIFGGFSLAGSVILAYILVAVFTFLWSLLFGLGLVVLVILAFVLISIGGAMTALGLLLILAAYVGFFIGLIWAVLRYAMVPFAIIDSQDPLSAMDAIRVSKAIMKGRKGNFFMLQLSFIGWFLLEYLIAMIGVIIVIVAAVGSAGDMMYYGYSSMPGLGAIAVIIPVALLCGAAIFVIDLWLTPYRTGCNARFYLYAIGGNQPIQPGPYGGQSGPYGGQSGPYGGQSGPYGSQSGPYGGQSGPYGSQPGPYGGQSGPYGSQSGPYNNPYQNPFGGYTQAQQPPQYGASTPQWGAPQAPQPPVYAAPEPPAAPAAPAAPDHVPAESADAPYEAPYAEPEAPSEDDTPQQPTGPSYPQY